MTRYATLRDDDLDAVRAYLPANYTANRAGTFTRDIIIRGEDRAGWTLDGYVIPRLASGLRFAREIDEDELDVLLEQAQAVDEMEAESLRGISAPDF